MVTTVISAFYTYGFKPFYPVSLILQARQNGIHILLLVGETPKPPAKNPAGFSAPKPPRCYVCTAALTLAEKIKLTSTENNLREKFM